MITELFSSAVHQCFLSLLAGFWPQLRFLRWRGVSRNSPSGTVFVCEMKSTLVKPCCQVLSPTGSMHIHKHYGHQTFPFMRKVKNSRYDWIERFFLNYFYDVKTLSILYFTCLYMLLRRLQQQPWPRGIMFQGWIRGRFNSSTLLFLFIEIDSAYGEDSRPRYHSVLELRQTRVIWKNCLILSFTLWVFTLHINQDKISSSPLKFPFNEMWRKVSRRKFVSWVL